MNITIAQIEIEDRKYDQNAEKLIRIISEHSNSDIILFPELALTGFPTSNEVDDVYSQSVEAFSRVQMAAQEVSAHVILGHIEKNDEGYYNSAYLMNGQGDLSVLHRKAHLWLDDIGVFQKGNLSSLAFCNQEAFGAQICFDLEFPEGSRTLAQAGAKLILMPNGNMHPYENTHFVLSQARAIENQLYVVTCNRVGTGHGGRFVGESVVVSPFGEVMLHLGKEEVIRTVDIDMKQVSLSRSEYSYINNL